MEEGKREREKEREGKAPQFQRTLFAEINEFHPVWNFQDNDSTSRINRRITVLLVRIAIDIDQGSNHLQIFFPAS